MATEQLLRVFTARNLSVRWGMKERDIRDLVDSGKLRGTYLGGKLLRISRQEVLEFEQRRGLAISDQRGA